MASIQNRQSRTGKRVYVVRWRDADGTDKSKSFDRQQAARDFRAEIEDRLAKGTYVDPGAGKVTLRIHAEEYLASSRASGATVAKNRSLLNAQILPALGDVPIAKMSPVRVNHFLADRSKVMAASTVRNLAEVLSALSHAAVDNGLLAKGWMPRQLHLPRALADDRVFLDHPRVIALIHNIPPLHQALVLTAAHTGMRWGELAGLKQSRVDLEEGRIDVVEALAYDGGAHYSPLKSGASRRTIGLTDVNLQAITEHIDEFGLGQHKSVFHGPEGALLRDDNFRKRVWLPAVAKTPEVPDHMNFHDLRHTHASLLILSGWDLKSVQVRLGHSSVAVTGDRYSHLFHQVEERGLDALNQAAEDAAS